MASIVLINPPLSLEERYGDLSEAGNTLPSIGICILAAVLRQAGHKVKIIEAASWGYDHRDALQAILEVLPDYVGITTLTLSIFSAAKLAEMIKQADKHIRVIIGGAHITAVPRETMEMFPQFDAGVLGEGEDTIVELLEAYENGADLKDVKGIVYREGREVVVTGMRPFIRDLDRIAFPAFELLPDFPRGYRPPAFRFKRLPAASIVTSRGCPYKCIFCDRSVFGSVCRGHSVDYVMEMIKDLVNRYGIREFLIEDDTFVTFKSRLIALCERILRENLKISWSSLGRVNSVDRDMLKLMKRAGCWQIGYGIESGNQKVLDFVNKKTTLEVVERAVRWTREAGILSKGFFILGHPTDTRETIEETIRFARKLDLHDVSVNMLTPLPGSQIYEVANQYGEFDNDWRKMNLLNVVFVPYGLTREELEGYYRRFLKEFYLRPRIIASYLKRIASNPRYSGRYLRGLGAFLRTAF